MTMSCQRCAAAKQCRSLSRMLHGNCTARVTRAEVVPVGRPGTMQLQVHRYSHLGSALTLGRKGKMPMARR